MNKIILSLLIGPAILTQILCAQNQPSQPIPAKQPGFGGLGSGVEQSPAQKFNLDFHGGSPRDLVSAIQEATGKPLNALISKEDESVEIPAMKFKSVTIPDLFAALTMASQRQEQIGGTPYTTYYTFDTQGHGDDAIYYFKCTKPRAPQEFCRFYQLGEDLQNYSIEDITTAIKTGWKMLGVKAEPMLKFHRETKLLIAVGPAEQLRTIDDALRELRTAPRQQKPAEKTDGSSTK
jgi:hypothetical protein